MIFQVEKYWIKDRGVRRDAVEENRNRAFADLANIERDAPGVDAMDAN
jgi:hypothetical protein